MVEQSAAEIRQLLGEGAWLKLGQVARLFDVDPSTVHRWIKAGRFRYRTTGGGQREMHPEDVIALLADSEQVRRDGEAGPGVPAG